MRIISFIILLAVFNTAKAEPLLFDNFDEVSVHTFWNELYSNGGWSLYCGHRFSQDADSPNERLIVIEHIYPVSWMLKHMNCQSRRQCRLDEKSVYTRMEADMHNLYPAWQAANVSRRETAFGMIAGEYWRFDDCDFERHLGITEPRPIARGNIARAIFYMHKQYNVPIDGKMLAALKSWNREDPPSKQEKIRNNLIEELQGNRNVFIDNPSLADKLAISVATGK